MNNSDVALSYYLLARESMGADVLLHLRTVANIPMHPRSMKKYLSEALTALEHAVK